MVKHIIGFALVLAVWIAAPALAQPAQPPSPAHSPLSAPSSVALPPPGDEFSPLPPGFPEGEEGPPSPGVPHERRGKGMPVLRGIIGPKMREHREEISAMGREITRVKDLIKSLEQEIDASPPGEARVALRQKLQEAKREQARLELDLSRKKMEITREALEFAQKRYDDARLELERVTRRIRKQHPDLIPPAPPVE